MSNDHVTTESLIDYLHRELPAEDDASVHAHISACAACRGAYHEQAALTERLRTFARSEEREVPPRVIYAVRERVARRARPAWLLQMTSVLRPAVGLPVAAIIVLGAILGFSSLARQVTHLPSIAAAYYLDDHATLTNRLLPFAQPPAIPATLAHRESPLSANVAADPQDAGAGFIASE